jgi:hypothetical protein
MTSDQTRKRVNISAFREILISVIDEPDKLYELGASFVLEDIEKTSNTFIVCDLCQTYKKNTALNCGHTCCSNCVGRLRQNKCPNCKIFITLKLKIYL